jgi:hypothetical protein
VTRSAARRAIDAGVGVACAAGGLWLAAHHPLSGAVAVVAWLLAAVSCAWRPGAWPTLVPALLPLLALATYSGWMVVEELDLLVLAVAAGGYLRRSTRREWPAGAVPSSDAALRQLLAVAYGGALVVSVLLGVRDAGGWAWSWWQGVHEPLNSVRLGKSFFLALLLAPLWRDGEREGVDTQAARLQLGVMTGLAGAVLVALWERLAFTGLLNFSSDYRTTAWFWEMKVGGAALDGFLALSLPFAVLALMRWCRPSAWAAAAALVLLTAYVALTTFSRVLYVALPLGIVVLIVLEAARQRRLAAASGLGPVSFGLVPATAWLLAFGVAAAAIFPTAGWRGLLAMLGASWLALALQAGLAGMSRRALALGLAAAGAASLALVAVFLSLDKGAYWGFAISWCAAAVCVASLRARSPAAPRELEAAALALFAATVVAMVLVCGHWSEGKGWASAAVAALALVTVTVGGAARSALSWPAAPRWQGALAACLAIVAGVVGGLGGGDYIQQRASTAREDLRARLDHWSTAFSWLRSPSDWAFGRGVGRYPSSHLYTGGGAAPPGDYRWRQTDRGPAVVLTGGRHEIDWGQILRLSQRVAAPGAAAVVTLHVRAERKVGLHLEICQKLLLYHRACLFDNVEVEPTGGRWRSLRVELRGERGERVDAMAGLWPRTVIFSVGLLTPSGRVEMTALSALDERGRELLSNGDFRVGLARWYATSDHHHMPWHMKSLPLHVAFDQGLVGALLGVLLLATALSRCAWGAVRDHPLAPALVASMAGFAVVGLIDSLLDAPRIAFLFYLLLLVMLALRPRRLSR